jgi:predicted transcriptional regulator
LDNDKLNTTASEAAPEQDVIQQEQFQQLRQEILYLSALRRKILIAFYYDQKTGDEIARELAIPSSTVRWHLKQAKETIKERINMTESTLYQPVRLLVKHYGNVHSQVYDLLQHDILMQNICWVCREKAKTVEEIAQTLGVAAIYLEYKLEQLLEMDYMKRVSGNKYRTTFYIWDDEFQIATERFRYDRALDLGLPMLTMLKKNLPKLKALGGLPKENDNFLLWALLPGVISYLEDEVIRKNQMEVPRPKRSDGSAHWLIVRTPYQDSTQNDPTLPDDFQDYCLNGDVHGVKRRDARPIHALQYDMMCFGEWRNFDSWDLLQLQQLRDLIASGRTPSETEKAVIAILSQKGYVEMANGTPYIAIPYLHGPAFRDFIAKTLPEYLDLDSVRNTVLDYGAYVKTLLPKGIDQQEQEFLCTDFFPEAAILYKLYQKGYLQEPSEAEKQRICTLVWEA